MARKKASDSRALALEQVEPLIREIRGEKVILDADLARLYGVATRVFNQAVKRNRIRFPEDFMFQLTRAEAESIRRSRSQNVTASSSATRIRSQIVTASKRNVRYLPYAFTEHGALQAANILNSPRAVKMSVFVIRAFIKMRETLLGTRALAKKLAALEKQLTGRLDSHEAAIVHVLQELMLILNPPPSPAPAKRQIGFGKP